ncbi:phosphoribosylanthranilate isomerase [Candidatus Poribacteria bacterium]|nr:phosphoribosylanthranilate isomerase [Candidatus Poribacteria bacterium]
MKNLIQVAGIIDQDEASMLIACGVKHLGFPLRLHDGREDLSEEEAKEIIHSLQPSVYGVVITYLNDAEEIAKFCREMGATWVQLHGSITVSEIEKLTQLAPDLFILKSLIVRKDNLAELKSVSAELSPYVDAFITDTFDPSTGRSGATGKLHDWRISQQLVDISPKPVILAGGLTADNVREAILQVKPAGVDSHTGVEGLDGRKNPRLMRQFVAEAREGFRLMSSDAV